MAFCLLRLFDQYSPLLKTRISQYGWGTFHLGFSGSTYPEPGRCHQADGKKWRCSRDAVPDQKYCERHINRGLHCSRKPVEGHTGQAASGPTNMKEVLAMSPPMSSLVTSNGGAFNSVTVAHQQHQIKGLQPAGATNTSADSIANRRWIKMEKKRKERLLDKIQVRTSESFPYPWSAPLRIPLIKSLQYSPTHTHG